MPASPSLAQDQSRSNQSSSYAALMKLIEARPDCLYRYTACLELHILSYKDSTKSKYDAQTATVEAEYQYC
jgi:hypothetical protein